MKHALLLLFLAVSTAVARDPQASPVREFEYAIEYPGLPHPLTVKVKVPEGYDTGDERYGVLYYTDSAISYGFVNDLVETLSWEQLPKLITVGIDVTPVARSKGRNFILTPTPWKVMETYLDVTTEEMGGGPIFLECIKQKIVPMIEEAFRTLPGERTFMGHSFGGLFGLFALFEEPSYFKNYVIGSPSLFWDEKLMLKLESEYSKNNYDLGVNLFLAVGTAEDDLFVDMDGDLQEFLDQLQSRNYQGLNLESGFWEGQQHMASMFLSYTEGVPFVFAENEPEAEPIPYGDNAEVGAFAEVNGIKMYYEVYGEGEPLLFIHGNGDSIKGWTAQIEHFSKTNKVIVADSRGHGKSGAGEDELTFELFAQDYAALIAHLKLQPVDIVGQSDGGIIALLLGIHHPETVDKMAIMGANLTPGPEAVDPWAPEWVQGKLDIVEKMIESGDTREGLKIGKKRLQLLLDHPNISVEDLAKIESPVLVMAGDRDIIREEHTVFIYQNIKNAHLCIFPGVTHFALFTDPELFNATIEKFMVDPFSMPSSQEIMSNW